MNNRRHVLAVGIAGLFTLMVGVVLAQNRSLFTQQALNSPDGAAAAMVPVREEKKFNARLAANANGSQITTTDTWVGTHTNRQSSITVFEYRNVALPARNDIKDAYIELTARTTSTTPIKGELFIVNASQIQGSNIVQGLSMVRNLTGGVQFNVSSEWRQNTSVKLPSMTNLISALAPATSSNFYAILKGSSESNVGRRDIFGIESGATAPKIVIVTERLVDDGKGTPTPSPVVLTPGPATPRPTAVVTAIPTPRPTATTVAASNAPAPTHQHATGGNSMAMAKWAPNPKFDTCPASLHDSYSVIGPDGKRYPTWHPPVVTNPATGRSCTFGHEHGRNPAEYQYFEEVRRGFAFDADKNGQISDAELATAGIPFGYANEQVDLYYASNPSARAFMRHEDHVGHKIEFANGEGDIGDGTDPFDNSKTGGVVVPVKNASGSGKFSDSGIRCYHFQKVHQGVSTADATVNNLHELIAHTKCNSTRADFPSSTSLTTAMVAFGAPGEFTRFCDADRFSIIRIGTNTVNQFFPGTRGVGMRNIVDRNCVEQNYLVPDGRFSSNSYELWDAAIKLYTPDGRQLIDNGNGGWEVQDALRYYYPGAPNNIGYYADLCYERLGDRQYRGGACSWMTDNGRIRGITWDDPRSAFRGLHRGQYVNPHIVNNAGGPGVWYTDPFGRNASATPFPGSIRQIIPSVNTRISFSSDPRIVLRNHNSGGNTVHGPN